MANFNVWKIRSRYVSSSFPCVGRNRRSVEGSTSRSCDWDLNFGCVFWPTTQLVAGVDGSNVAWREISVEFVSLMKWYLARRRVSMKCSPSIRNIKFILCKGVLSTSTSNFSVSAAIRIIDAIIWIVFREISRIGVCRLVWFNVWCPRNCILLPNWMLCCEMCVYCWFVECPPVVICCSIELMLCELVVEID